MHGPIERVPGQGVGSELEEEDEYEGPVDIDDYSQLLGFVEIVRVVAWDHVAHDLRLSEDTCGMNKVLHYGRLGAVVSFRLELDINGPEDSAGVVFGFAILRVLASMIA